MVKLERCEIFRIWDELTKAADKMDWVFPTEDRGGAMEEHPEFMAGASSVDWQEQEKEENEDEDDSSDYPEEDFTGGDEESMYDEDQEKSEIEYSETPVIKAVGIDFPMLLHEAVKGIFELLSINGLPEDEIA
jgi:hypothetical protein